MMDDPMIGRMIGGYRLERVLGRGGMATVYLAWDEKLRRQVVVKVMLPFQAGDDNFQARFQQEAFATARLSHPNIVHIYDMGQQNDLTYMVMEFLPGGSLHDLIRSKGRVEPGQAVSLISQMALALDYAHQNGIIHRDVKPANILFAKDGRAVLTDLGIAKALEGPRLTRAMLAVGTPEYMSPEQGRGDPIDGRSDLYALGIVLYELLSGILPYQADTPWGIIYKHMTEPLPPIQKVNADISLALRSVTEKALAKRPEDRFQTGRELADALRRALETPGKRLYPPPPIPILTQARSGAASPSSATADSKTRLLSSPAGTPAALAPAQEQRKGGRAWIWISAGVLALLIVAVVLLRGGLAGKPPAASDDIPASVPTAASIPTATRVTQTAPTVTLAVASASAVVPTARPTVSPVPPAATNPPAARADATATSVPPTSTSAVKPPAARVPTATPIPAAASTVPPTAVPTRPKGTSAAPRPATAALAGITVVGPEIGATLRGTVTFEWRDASGFALGPGEQYELIFWTPGQDPMVSGLSPVGASNDKVKTFDLAQFESLLGLTPGGSYFWGVRLWDGSRAVRMLSEARSFIYERTGGGSSGGGVPPTHEPPPP